ncbi:unnamed protein product [Vitrella brassicaformis CCMP3155]|uniref:Proteasome subunit beta n=1 Tax=Vitrella brassicaformis (strain CCMP3155) TaxID=1169540 RepID=A0A0G4EU17_VITBC|nr:unnamed protein product [Vitrella brassicaformis CCMP3155]|mmetsp:Transcript_29792/g.86412  ORF Transcript_29792/g.86412 Transcript_29792/m.86412 type:complete len:272 (+) Transcript_29792:38-853(+)|eukprot:CEM02127.1 unnamed protein product [Vitrella brassicaformis CCMP3155]
MEDCLRLRGRRAPDNYGYSYHGDYNQHVLCGSAVSSGQEPIKHTTRPITTSSTVIGLKFNGGTIVMSDTGVCYGNMLRFKSCERFCQVGDRTVVAASGEYSDFQYLTRDLKEMDTRDWVQEDGCSREPSSIAAYLGRTFYGQRSRLDPYWNQMIMAGWQKTSNEPYLGYIDLYGTTFPEDYIASGFGSYLAIPLLRKEYRPDMTEDEAKALLQKCFMALFYRDCTGLSTVQYAVATSAGIRLSDVSTLTHKWDYKLWLTPTSQLPVSASSW